MVDREWNTPILGFFAETAVDLADDPFAVLGESG